MKILHFEQYKTWLLAIVLLMVFFNVNAKKTNAYCPDSLICVVSERPEYTNIHVRRCGGDWQLIWNYTDSLNYCAIEKLHTSPVRDNIYGYSTDIVVYNVSEGKIENRYTKLISHTTPNFSIRIKGDNTYFHAAVGDGTNLSRLIKSDKFYIKPNTKVILRSSAKSDEVFTICQQKNYLTPQYAELDVNTISNDDTGTPIGLWEYLDSDIAEPRVFLGGKYRIAIVKDTDGNYNIIYVDGATEYVGFWHEGMIRGKLKKTSIPYQYDLEWIDATQRYVLDDDNYALYNEPLILVLSFPVYKSTVRFRRVL